MPKRLRKATTARRSLASALRSAVSARVRAFSSRPAARSSKLSHRAVAEAATRSASSRCFSAPSRTVCNALSWAFSENTSLSGTCRWSRRCSGTPSAVFARARDSPESSRRDRGGRSLIVGATWKRRRLAECHVVLSAATCVQNGDPKIFSVSVPAFVWLPVRDRGFHPKTKTIARSRAPQRRAHPRRNAGPAPERRPRRSDHAATRD